MWCEGGAAATGDADVAAGRSGHDDFEKLAVKSRNAGLCFCMALYSGLLDRLTRMC